MSLNNLKSSRTIDFSFAKNYGLLNFIECFASIKMTCEKKVYISKWMIVEKSADGLEKSLIALLLSTSQLIG
jgi:hypothetical protein